MSTDIRNGKSQVMYLGRRYSIIFERIEADFNGSNIYYQIMCNDEPSEPLITVHSSLVTILPYKFGQEPDIVY